MQNNENHVTGMVCWEHVVYAWYQDSMHRMHGTKSLTPIMEASYAKAARLTDEFIWQAVRASSLGPNVESGLDETPLGDMLTEFRHVMDIVDIGNEAPIIPMIKQ